jgi:hypothetical protein
MIYHERCYSSFSKDTEQLVRYLIRGLSTTMVELPTDLTGAVVLSFVLFTVVVIYSPSHLYDSDLVTLILGLQIGRCTIVGGMNSIAIFDPLAD